VEAALASALFLGVIPIFGKQAITAGFSPLAVVAFRTILAAGLLLLIVAIFRRPFLFYLPGWSVRLRIGRNVNGLGSLLYYFALERLSVSVGQLLYSLYPLFLVIWLVIDRQPPSSLTYWRIGFALLG